VSKERVGSIIFFLVGFYGLIFGIQMPLGKWNEPGPGIFPLFLSILLCAFGILWFILGKDKEKAMIPWASFIKQIINTVRTPAKNSLSHGGSYYGTELAGLLNSIRYISPGPLFMDQSLQYMDFARIFPCCRRWLLVLFWKIALRPVAAGHFSLVMF
jgi:hypothetical protein